MGVHVTFSMTKGLSNKADAPANGRNALLRRDFIG
jgi:hypothetical protein